MTSTRDCPMGDPVADPMGDPTADPVKQDHPEAPRSRNSAALRQAVASQTDGQSRNCIGQGGSAWAEARAIRVHVGLVDLG
jgi:hypothetical protein